MSPILLALALTAAAPVSSSRLGVVLGGSAIAPGSSAANVLAACPRLAVFQANGTNADVLTSQIQLYRSLCSGLVVVEMATLGAGYSTVNGAMVPAWWQTWSQQLRTIETFAGNIDVIVGPGDVTPTSTAAGTHDVADFWSGFVQQVQLSGLGALPAIGAVGPGVPATLTDFCDVVTAVHATGISFAWSYHGRSALASDVTDASLAYRQITSGCGIATVPLYVTQAGPTSGAWESADVSWLWWYEQQLAHDANVIGAALYALGTSPDLSAISTDLATYFQNPGPPDNGGGDGGGGGGSGGQLPPQPGGGAGTLSPAKTGCATADAGALGLLVLPALLVRRRRSARHGTKR